MARRPVTDWDRVFVLKFLVLGRDAAFIAEACHIDLGDVADIAKDGWRLAGETLQAKNDREAWAALPPALTVHPAPPDPAPPEPPPPEEPAEPVPEAVPPAAPVKRQARGLKAWCKANGIRLDADGQVSAQVRAAYQTVSHR